MMSGIDRVWGTRVIETLPRDNESQKQDEHTETWHNVETSSTDWHNTMKQHGADKRGQCAEAWHYAEWHVILHESEQHTLLSQYWHRWCMQVIETRHRLTHIIQWGYTRWAYNEAYTESETCHKTPRRDPLSTHCSLSLSVLIMRNMSAYTESDAAHIIHYAHNEASIQAYNESEITLITDTYHTTSHSKGKHIMIKLRCSQWAEHIHRV